MSNFNKEYNEEAIDALVGAERVRQRPAAILGSDGLPGAQHGVTEIWGNAIDEFTSGFGHKLQIKYHADKSISVRDFGRGVPMQGHNAKLDKPTWYALFNEMYAGGKYKSYREELLKIDRENRWDEFNPKDFNYLYSIGLNGLGAASTQYTSEFFVVESYKNGEMSKMTFEHGYPTLDDLIIEPTNEPDGTFIHWKPDIQVFKAVEVGSKFIRGLATSTAYVTGITVDYIDEVAGVEETFEAGTIKELIASEYGEYFIDEEGVFQVLGLDHGHTLDKNEDSIYIFEYEMVLAPLTDPKGKVEAYHNAIKMVGDEERSAHQIGVTLAMDEFLKKINKDYNVKIKKGKLRDYFAIIIKSFSNIASYANQTKDLIDDEFAIYGIKAAVTNLINLEYNKENEYIKETIDILVEEARELAELEEQRKRNRQIKKATKKKVKVDKFMPSVYYDKGIVPGSELWLVEGDSASGTAGNGRDSKYQAIMPLKGKPLNVMKTNLEKILANPEISNLFQIMGAGINIPEADEYFDIDKMKFDKIVICTDADIDGFQIRMLIMLIFMKFAPQVIESGRLVVAKPPLYTLVYNGNVTRYAIDKVHRKEVETEFGVAPTVRRNKGLGEMNADEFTVTTMDVEYTKGRNIVPIKFDTSDPEIIQTVDMLFGEDIGKGRKNLLLKLLGSDLTEFIDEDSEVFNFLDDVEIKSEIELQDVVI